MTRVLVTGGTGFVGRAAVAALAARGFEVHATARVPEPLAGVRCHACDLLAPGGPESIVARVRPTHLLHLAWIATPATHAVSPENALWLEASTRLAEAFLSAGGRRLVVAGTYAEYAPSDSACAEDHPLADTTPYTAAKLALSGRLSALCGAAGVVSAWARLVTMFGPFEHPNRVVAAAMRTLLAGGVAEFGSGAAVRDFMHIRDAGDALATLTGSEWDGPINVSSDERHSIRAVVERIARLAGAADRVRFGVRPPNPFDPPFLGADGSALRRLGWRPAAGLEASLADAMEWWRPRVRRAA